VYKRRIVAATAENVDNAVVVALPGLVQALIELALVGSDDLLQQLCADSRQLWRGPDGGMRARHANINIEISHRRLGEPVGVVLHPLRRADDAVLLGVPRSNDTGEIRLR
jgi:hypothetical protein